MAGTPTVSRGVRDAQIDTTGLRVNIAETLDAIDPRDIPFLSMLGWPKVAPKDAGGAAGADSLSFECTEELHTWLNDELIPNSFKLNAAYTAGDGQLDLGTTIIKYVQTDDILMSQSGVDFQITDFNDTTGIATVSVVSGSTDANIAANEIVHRLGNANIEGATGTIGGQTPDPTQTSNNVQHIDDEVSITDVEAAVLRYGISDNSKRHISQMVQQNVLQFEKMLIYNRISPAATSRTSKPRFGGLRNYIRLGTMEESDQLIDANGAALTEDMFERVTRAIYLAGGAADCVMVPPFHKSTIDKWLQPFRRTDFKEKKYAGIVDSYSNSWFDGQIVVNRHLDASDIVFLTKKFIGVGPLKGNQNLQFSLRELADRGRTADWYFCGSYTMEVRNATRAHGWIYNLARS